MRVRKFRKKLYWTSGVNSALRTWLPSLSVVLPGMSGFSGSDPLVVMMASASTLPPASPFDSFPPLAQPAPVKRFWREVSVGAAGHVNGDSGLGAWPEGQALLARLLAA